MQESGIYSTTTMTMKHIIKGLLTVIAVAASPLAVKALPPIPTYPGGAYGVPITTGEELFANGGDVTLTFLGPTGASYDESLFVVNPGLDPFVSATNPEGLFFDNHATTHGATVDLGDVTAGTEIEFGIFVNSTGFTYFDGPASRNFDGFVHAYMVNDYGAPDTTYVGFEDLLGTQADFNYSDEIYSFTGATASVNPPTVPDAGSTLPMMGMGLAALAGMARRFRRK
jgi:hypothetical protein